MNTLDKPFEIRTECQAKHGLAPLAKVTKGYAGEGDKGFYLELRPIRGGPTTVFLSQEEITALLEQLPIIADDPDSSWPDEGNR
jgi:hypothetical protein